MNKMITEDIIRQALNESINEFILEEGDGWNRFKNSSLGKIGKGLWNGIKMYMDYKTNGQWNNKYNQHVSGKGFTTGSYYISKWLKRHYNRLQDIIYGDYYGNKTYFYARINGRNQCFQHDWKNNIYTLRDNYSGCIYTLKLDRYGNPYTLTVKTYYGKEESKSINTNEGNYKAIFESGFGPIYLSKGEDSTTPEEYITKYCNFNSFIQYTRNSLGNGQMKDAILTYIDEKIQKPNEVNKKKLKKSPNEKINYNDIINSFTLNSFYAWLGQNLKRFENTNNNKQSQQQSKIPQQQGQQQSQQQGQDWSNDEHFNTFQNATKNGTFTTNEKADNNSYSPYGKYNNGYNNINKV